MRDSSSDGDKVQAGYQGDYAFDLGATSNLLTWAYEYVNEGFNQRGAAGPFGDPNQDQHMDTHSVIGEYVIDWDWASASLSARHDDNSDFDDSNDYRAALRIPIVNPDTTLYRQRRHRHEGSDVRGTLRLHAGHVHRQSRICAPNDRAACR